MSPVIETPDALCANPAVVCQWLTEVAPKLRQGYSQALARGHLDSLPSEKQFAITEQGLLTTLLAVAYATQATEYLELQHRFTQRDNLQLFLNIQTVLRTPSPLLPTIPLGGALMLKMEEFGVCRLFIGIRHYDVSTAIQEAQEAMAMDSTRSS